MLSSLDVSTSALVAQRVRMNVLASNLANMSTTHNEHGEVEPYQPRFVVLETQEGIGPHGSAGVSVDSVQVDDAEPRYRYEPNHPDAIQQGPYAGYVAYPNIDMMTEFTHALEAARAYEANLGAIEIAKNMTQETLRILV
ncbi:MAG: flagellar basal body rod protein FlgC [Planctomycetota bacterium]|jgi:flagellar basal-body rod protein FlgC